jgi:hypothetical protein
MPDITKLSEEQIEQKLQGISAKRDELQADAMAYAAELDRRTAMKAFENLSPEQLRLHRDALTQTMETRGIPTAEAHGNTKAR